MTEKQNLLSLKSDWVFKRIFGKEGNEDILLDLLSAILNINIKKVELKNTELTKNTEDQKKSILDIKAILNKFLNSDILNQDVVHQIINKIYVGEEGKIQVVFKIDELQLVM